ncbi:transmembrane protein 209 isoform X2 [Nematostella vectensis]|nr:transmembrane protein 209 isoform X2 [Nematostella vectensis]XP_048580919.1 transmembrane protein 209 isoform X2 [Nematostella vectensis]
MFGSISYYLDVHHPYIWYGELILAVWFSVGFIVDLFYYLQPVISQNTILLSPKQCKLLGVRQSDVGFKLKSPDDMPRAPSHSAPSTPISPFTGSTPPRKHKVTPPGPSSTTPGSFSQTPYLNTATPDTSLRSRSATPTRSPYSPSDCISSLEGLTDFLKEQEKEELLLQRVSPESITPGRGTSYWSPYRQDYTPPLGVYRIARRSPDVSSSHDDGDSGYSSTRADEIWNKLGITRADLDHWTENCRKWLCQTILVRLVEQIDSVNDVLCRIGCQELQIGTISLSSLRQVAVTKADQVPQLRAIIPYLEASTNQEYLVQRIRELSKGGCLGVYRWNSGGMFRGKPWEQDLFADSQIVMHLFCTYMDSRLPADPRFPDGRTFTGLHFLKTPDKPADARKSDLSIYMARLHPPHYKIVVKDEVYDIPKGRNNLFHAIIFFLHHIKTEHYGMLGRVNLGLSGVNIMCIMNKK